MSKDKLLNKEYSGMFTGRQLHSFFSSWKADKKNWSGKEIDGNCSSSGRKDSHIHVFDRSQDEVDDQEYFAAIAG